MTTAKKAAAVQHPEPRMDVVSAAIVRDGRILMIQRAPKPGWPMLDYVFATPGGRVEPGETHVDALAREIYEELGLLIDGLVKRYVYVSELDPPLVSKPVRVTCYLVEWGQATHEPSALEGVVGFAWFHGPGLAALELAPADAAGLRQLQAAVDESRVK